MDVRKRLKTGRDNLRSLMKTFSGCLRLSWQASRFYTVVRIGTKAAVSLLSVAAVYVGRAVINLLTGAPASGGLLTGSPQGTLLFLLFLVLLTSVLSGGLQKWGDYCSGIHNDMVSNQVTMNMMDISLRADLELFDSPRYYDAFENVRRDTARLAAVLWSAIDSIGSLVTVVSCFAALCGVGILVPLLIIAAAIPATIVNQQYTRRLYRWGLKHVKEERQLSYLNYIMTNRSYAQDIRLFHIGGSLKARYSTLWHTFFTARRHMIRRRTIFSALFAILPEIVIVALTAVLAFSVLGARYTVGDYTLYTGMMGQLSSGVFLFINMMMSLYESKLRVDNIEEFRQYRNRVTDTGTRIPEGPLSVRFDHVRFRYPDTEQDVLEDVSFTIEEGQRVCLIGVNGAGKSTIIKLLLRVYDADAGAVLINGHDIREYDLTALRRCFSCLFQQFVNYAFTLRENVALPEQGLPADEQASDDQRVRDAMVKAGCSEVLESAGCGLDTYLTKAFEDDGIELSGGQYQRIALARVFYRDSRMILLDEPSASLDPEAEHHIFESFETLCEGKTALFTSHRLSNVHMADKIIVLENGRVIEEGTHEQLMSNPRRYSTLYRYQADKFR